MIAGGAILAGRRGFIAGAAALAAVPRASASPTLFLHSEGLSRHGAAAENRRDADPCGWTEHQVRVLTHGNFSDTEALLRQARGCRVVALLNDADVLVIETLLVRQGAQRRTIRRVQRAAWLLSATL